MVDLVVSFLEDEPSLKLHLGDSSPILQQNEMTTF